MIFKFSEEICTFVIGDGTGGTEEKIGDTDTEDECADLVRSTKPSANGATWGADWSNRRECYAEYNATGIDDDFIWKTCLFNGKLL